MQSGEDIRMRGRYVPESNCMCSNNIGINRGGAQGKTNVESISNMHYFLLQTRLLKTPYGSSCMQHTEINSY